MARISLDPPRTLSYRLGEWYARRHYGQTLLPGQAAGHNARVLRTMAMAEWSLTRWHTVPDELKQLAVISTFAVMPLRPPRLGGWRGFLRVLAGQGEMADISRR